MKILILLSILLWSARGQPQFSCQNINCVQTDPNSKCVNGACLCEDGFVLIAGICRQDNIGLQKALEYRTINGSGNNLFNPRLGELFAQELRLTKAAYKDGISIPRGAGGDLPSAREISNLVMGKPGLHPGSRLGYTDWVTFWGQIIDHDITWTPIQKKGEIEFDNIPVPAGDPVLDPKGFGNATIAMRRTQFVAGTGTDVNNPREHFNAVTAFLDASIVYGEVDDKALALRELQGGRLRVGAGGKLPPLSNFGFLQLNLVQKVKDEDLYFFGDVRGNDHVGMDVLHFLFVLEHNRIAQELSLAKPEWDDETLYQEARRRLIAILQVINENEYLPLLLGEPMSPYKGYNPLIDPGMLQEFSQAAFRYGHSEVNDNLLVLDAQYKNIPGTPIAMKDTYMDPSWLANFGMEPFLRGMSRNLQREMDAFSAESIRSFLFHQPDGSFSQILGGDLLAIAIQRSRETGVADFNTVRRALGLLPYRSFSEMTDPVTAANLEKAYNGKIDDCDLVVCGMAESQDVFQEEGTGKFVLAHVGQTFRLLIKKQFENVRDGDRFYYQNNQFSQEELAVLQRTTLAQVVLRNSDIEEIQCFVMSLPDGCFLRKEGIKTDDFPVSEKENEFTVIVAPKSEQHPQAKEGFAFGYVLNGEESPDLTLVRGTTYRFVVQSSCSHRMYITTSPVGEGVEPVTDGVIGSENSCLDGVMEFTPNENHPDTGLFYQCQYHENMGGAIRLVNDGRRLVGSIFIVVLAIFSLLM